MGKYRLVTRSDMDGLVSAVLLKELDLIDFFIKNNNRIISSDELKLNIWEDSLEATDSALKNLLTKVRKKIGKESITNISGVGYRLSF